jgi:hypothetical protein
MERGLAMEDQTRDGQAGQDILDGKPTSVGRVPPLGQPGEPRERSDGEHRQDHREAQGHDGKQTPLEKNSSLVHRIRDSVWAEFLFNIIFTNQISVKPKLV